jgi:hypothetical protein
MPRGKLKRAALSSNRKVWTPCPLAGLVLQQFMRAATLLFVSTGLALHALHSANSVKRLAPWSGLGEAYFCPMLAEVRDSLHAPPQAR